MSSSVSTPLGGRSRTQSAANRVRELKLAVQRKGSALTSSLPRPQTTGHQNSTDAEEALPIEQMSSEHWSHRTDASGEDRDTVRNTRTKSKDKSVCAPLTEQQRQQQQQQSKVYSPTMSKKKCFSSTGAVSSLISPASFRSVTSEHLEEQRAAYLSGLPWWKRMVLDDAFRRRVATLAVRALRLEEEYFLSDEDAQNISLPPLFRWEAMSASNRAVTPSPGASCGPLDGITHRWKGNFPPNGYVQLTPNTQELRPKPQKKGPFHINVFVPMRPTKAPEVGGTSPDGRLSPTAATGGCVDTSLMTIGQRIAAYESEQQRLLEAELEAKRQLREAASGGGGRGAATAAQSARMGKMGVDAEGHLTVDGVRLEHKFVGCIRPSFLLFRWKLLCNSLHEFAMTSSGGGQFGLQPSSSGLFGGANQDLVKGNGGAVGAPQTVADTMPANGQSLGASSVGPSAPGGVVASSGSSRKEGNTGGTLPPWLDGIPRFPFPVFRVESQPAQVTIDKDNPRHAVVQAFPPTPSFCSLCREDLTDSRRMFLFQSPACKKAVHRIFAQLPVDATSRLHKQAYVEFVLDLLNVFMPTLHAQHNIEVAEDEWICRGTPEHPDFSLFYQNFFDFPLILCREKVFMTEELYVSVWDILFEALYGRDKLLRLYEVDIRRSLGMPTKGGSALGDGGATKSQQDDASLSSPPAFAEKKDTGVPLLEDEETQWMSHLPEYLKPLHLLKPSMGGGGGGATEASCSSVLLHHRLGIEVPRLRNTDHYALHTMSELVLKDPSMVGVDPTRRAFLAHRMASIKLAQRAALEEKHAAYQQSNGARNTSSGSTKNQKPSENDNADEDDENAGGPRDLFPSVAVQVKRVSKLSPEHMNAKQKEEARRVNAILSVENKASSLNLYEEVYVVEELPKDEIDDILDYCSDVSDTELDDDHQSIRARYEEIYHVETRDAHSLLTKGRGDEPMPGGKRVAAPGRAASISNRSAADSDSVSSVAHIDMKRRISHLGRLRQPSIMFQVVSGRVDANTKNATNSTTEDGAGNLEDPAPDEPYDVNPVCGGGDGSRPSAVSPVRLAITNERAEQIRREERQRVRLLAATKRTPSGNRAGAIVEEEQQRSRPITSSTTTVESGSAVKSALRDEVPSAYRTFSMDHMVYSTSEMLVLQQEQQRLPRDDSPVTPTNGAAPGGQNQDVGRYPHSAGSSAPQLMRGYVHSGSVSRPTTATSAHAALVVRPTLRLTVRTRRLLSAEAHRNNGSACGGGRHDATAADDDKGRSHDPIVEHGSRRAAGHGSVSNDSRDHREEEATSIPPSSEALASRRRELLAALLTQQSLDDDEGMTTNEQRRQSAPLRQPQQPQPHLDDAEEEHEKGLGQNDEGRVQRPPMMPSFLSHTNKERARKSLGDLKVSSLLRPRVQASRTAGVKWSEVAHPDPSSSQDVTKSILAVSPDKRNNLSPPRRGPAGGSPEFEAKVSELLVKPIRPPKYRVPHFSVRKEPDELRVNGTVLVKSHPTIELVQRIALQQQLLGSSADNTDNATSSSATVTPRPLGMGLPAHRHTITSHSRTVIVVPTETLRVASEAAGRKQVEEGLLAMSTRSQ